MTERKKFVCLFLCVFLCMAMGILPASAAKENDKTPVFADGMAQPVLTYTNLRELDYTNEGSDILRFCVYVETDYDTDSDGMADLVEALVQVPRPAAEGAFKAATIYDPTPYGAGTVDEDEMNSTNPGRVRIDAGHGGGGGPRMLELQGPLLQQRGIFLCQGV